MLTANRLHGPLYRCRHGSFRCGFCVSVNRTRGIPPPSVLTAFRAICRVRPTTSTSQSLHLIVHFWSLCFQRWPGADLLDRAAGPAGTGQPVVGCGRWDGGVPRSVQTSRTRQHHRDAETGRRRQGEQAGTGLLPDGRSFAWRRLRRAEPRAGHGLTDAT